MSKYETLVEYEKSVYDMMSGDGNDEIEQVVDLLFKKITTHPHGFAAHDLHLLEAKRKEFAELIMDCKGKTLYFNTSVFEFLHVMEPDGFYLNFQENGIQVLWNKDEEWLIRDDDEV